MSSITPGGGPVGSPGPSSPLGDQIESLLGYVPQNLITDVLEGNIVIDPATGKPAAGKLRGETFIELIAAIQDAQQTFKDEIRRGDILLPLLLKPFHEAQAEIALMIIALQRELAEQLAEWQGKIGQHNQDINDVNTSGSDYSDSVDDNATEDHQQRTVMQDAIDDYNLKLAAYNEAVSGEDPEEIAEAEAALEQAAQAYTSAAEDYNQYVTGRNAELISLASEYNSAVDEYNSHLNDLISDMQKINEDRVKLGKPTLSYPTTQAETITTPTFSTISEDPPSGFISDLADYPDFNQTPSSFSLIISPSIDDVVSILQDVQAVLLNTLAHSSSKTDLLIAHIDRQRELRGKNIVLPNAIWERTPPQYLADATGAGAGTGPASMVIGLSSKNLLRLLSFSQAIAEANDQEIPLSPQVIDQLKSFTLSLFSSMALESAAPAAKELIASLPNLDPNSVETKTTLSLKLLENVASLISSGAIDEGVRKILAESGLTDQQIEGILPALSAAISLGLINLSLAELGVSLQLPNLVTETNTAGSEKSNEDNVRAQVAKVNIGDILANLFSLLSIKTNLKDQLVEDLHLANQEAINLANAIINNLVRSSPNSIGQVRSQLNAILSGQGLDPLAANKLANGIVERILGEFGISNTLPTAFNPNFNQDELGTLLINLATNFGEAGRNTLIQAAISNAVGTDGVVSVGDFRSALVGQFKAAGFTAAQAHYLANQAVAFIDGGADAVSPPTGANAETIAVIQGRLSEAFSTDDVDDLFAVILGGSIFSNEQSFLINLREGLVNQFGNDAVQPFEEAVVHAKSGQFPNTVSPESIAQQIEQQVTTLLGPKLGAAKTQEIGQQIIRTILGSRTPNDFQSEEVLQPNSILSLIEAQKDTLKVTSNDNSYNAWLDNLHAISQYNTEVSMLLTNVFAAPTAFIGSVADGFSHGKRSTDIPQLV